MLLGNVRGDLYSNCRSSRSAPHLASSYSISSPMSSSSYSVTNSGRTSMTPQQTMNYARMSYRYTTVTLLSMRPQPELTIFPDHLVERRFLDEENFIDLDRMLLEKAGKFRLESYGILDGAGDGPITSRRVHKYDFSDPVVIEKVKNRRPKDPLTPHQVAALTSVVTRHQPSSLATPLLSAHNNVNAHVWVDDYSHRATHFEHPTHRQPLTTQPSMPYQRQNPNQCEPFTNQAKPVLPKYRSTTEENIAAAPILQRLFQAQIKQQNEHQRTEMDRQQSPNIRKNHQGSYDKGLSAFATPVTPVHTHSSNTLGWPFSTSHTDKPAANPLQLLMGTQSTIKQNQNILTQLINDQARYSTTMQTPITPSNDLIGLNDYREMNDDDDFYSAPPSPTHITEESSNNLNDQSSSEQARIYDQATFLNSLIRDMVNEQQNRQNKDDFHRKDEDIYRSSSNDSCSSKTIQSNQLNLESSESYTEMYNLVRLLSPGVKSMAQQELLQYLERGCNIEREEVLRLIACMNMDEQNALKPILLRLINEQVDVMKNQQGHPNPNHHRSNTQFTQSHSPLESWFGTGIYRKAYPRMPSGGVLSVCDLEQSRLN